MAESRGKWFDRPATPRHLKAVSGEESQKHFNAGFNISGENDSMSESQLSIDNTDSEFDLGRDIGAPKWFAQLFLLFGLIAAVTTLGIVGTRGPDDTRTAQDTPTAGPAAENDTRLSAVDPTDGATAVLAPLTVPAIEPKAPQPVTKTLTVGRGDTLGNILNRAGVAARPAYRAITALSDVYDPRDLRAGQTVAIAFDPDGKTFKGFDIAADVDRTVVVNRASDGGFTAAEKRVPLEQEMVRAGNVINDSLYLAAERIGIPAGIIVRMIRIFSFEVDFQRELRAGDRFEVYFETFEDETGQPVKYGNIEFVSLTVSGKNLDLYRYTPQDTGETEYFHPDGKSARRFLMKTPVDGARLSSHFGPRKHPIQGYTRMHEGTDFAAPRGTPIMAAGNGVVERANRYGGYGNYVRIRHNGTYKTAYAHMNRFANGIGKGSRVSQGQIIGYVGSTGNSTGPHLHYEVHVNNEPVNSLTLDVPTGRTLKGTELARFKEALGPMQERIAATPMVTSVASRQ